jgi:uncharacterized membrane protein YgdD (TMEM256/DUF423 family)
MTAAGWRIAAWGAGAGALAVALGAFGAHGLEGAVSPDRLATWRTGATYHLAHALAAVVAGAAAALTGASAAAWAGRLFLAGVALFSGSLYALVLLDLPVLGAVAPLGGLAFIAGWAALGLAAWRLRRGGPLLDPHGPLE